MTTLDRPVSSGRCSAGRNRRQFGGGPAATVGDPRVAPPTRDMEPDRRGTVSDRRGAWTCPAPGPAEGKDAFTRSDAGRATRACDARTSARTFLRRGPN